MKSELQNKLFKEYPEIFAQKDLDKTQTAMCWGISCGDGWYDLIDNLCGNIKNRVENVRRQNEYKNEELRLVPVPTEKFTCQAVQVKEKFGGLCFYICGGDDYIDGLISMAESMSYNICSNCGNKADPENKKDRGWIYTLCKNCKE